MNEACLKRLHTVWFQLCDLWKRQNYGDSKNIRSGVGEGEMNRQSTGFLGKWIYSVWYYIIHLSKPIECTTPRVYPNVNCGLWVIMMCGCRFIGWDRCPTLVGDVDYGGGCACVEAGGVCEVSAPSLQFCSEPKTALKKEKSLLKKVTKNLLSLLWYEESGSLKC